MSYHKVLLSAAVGLCGLLAASAAVACQGKTVILEDKFKDDSGGWDTDPTISFQNSAMTVRMAAEQSSFRDLNLVFLVREADICVDATFPATTDNDPGVGIIFWAPDYKAFYLFMVFISGKVGIHRFADNNFVTVHSQPMAEVKKGPGATNQLRVTLKGNLVTMYVNGTKYRDQRSPPPTKDSMFGLYAQFDKVTPGQTFLFTNLKVTSVD